MRVETTGQARGIGPFLGTGPMLNKLSFSTSVLFRIVSVVLVYAAWFTFETGGKQSLLLILKTITNAEGDI